MYIDSNKKREIFKKFGKGESDTGSAEGQIAKHKFFSAHIDSLFTVAFFWGNLVQPKQHFYLTIS